MKSDSKSTTGIESITMREMPALHFFSVSLSKYITKYAIAITSHSSPSDSVRAILAFGMAKRMLYRHRYPHSMTPSDASGLYRNSYINFSLVGFADQNI